MMKGIKAELLGMGVILLGIALSINNDLASIGGVLGIGIMVVGCFLKDRDE